MQNNVTEMKVTIVGQQNSGKSSLKHMFIHQSFDELPDESLEKTMNTRMLRIGKSVGLVSIYPMMSSKSSSPNLHEMDAIIYTCFPSKQTDWLSVKADVLSLQKSFPNTDLVIVGTGLDREGGQSLEQNKAKLPAGVKLFDASARNLHEVDQIFSSLVKTLNQKQLTIELQKSAHPSDKRKLRLMEDLYSFVKKMDKLAMKTEGKYISWPASLFANKCDSHKKNDHDSAKEILGKLHELQKERNFTDDKILGAIINYGLKDEKLVEVLFSYFDETTREQQHSESVRSP